jgi:hypothetical protein
VSKHDDRAVHSDRHGGRASAVAGAGLVPGAQRKRTRSRPGCVGDDRRTCPQRASAFSTTTTAPR